MSQSIRGTTPSGREVEWQLEGARIVVLAEDGQRIETVAPESDAPSLRVRRASRVGAIGGGVIAVIALVLILATKRQPETLFVFSAPSAAQERVAAQVNTPYAGPQVAGLTDDAHSAPTRAASQAADFARLSLVEPPSPERFMITFSDEEMRNLMAARNSLKYTGGMLLALIAGLLLWRSLRQIATLTVAASGTSSTLTLVGAEGIARAEAFADALHDARSASSDRGTA